MQEKIHGSSFYHVMVQGINKEYIFKKDQYIKKYKEIIKEKLYKSNVIVLAYCIMNNHAHILIYTEKSQYLGKYMQRLNTTYSNYYNRMEKRIGYVFRDRYMTQDILSKKQLYNCLVYIHHNPVKAKIVDKPYKYNYSSYNEFLEKKDIINDDSIRLIFENDIEWKETFDKIHKNYSDKNFLDVKEKEIKAIVEEYEKKYNIKIGEIRNNKTILKSFIKKSREETDVTLIELAEILNISKSTVANYNK